jgi:hypothetical protein
VKPRKRNLLDGQTVPEIGAVLSDGNGLTWRVLGRSEDSVLTMRPTNGAWLTVLRTPAMLAGWDVL